MASPRQQTLMPGGLQSFPSISSNLESLDMRADPDAQATVTDFLDFTEYLPADMVRSLTLIGKIDQRYAEASKELHDVVSIWSRLPSIPADERPAPVRLRADISEKANTAFNFRLYAHSEAVHMSKNVEKHYNRAKTILEKLKTMRENYPPPEEQKMAALTRSPQASRTNKISVRVDGAAQKPRRQRVPRITVPGEVLAPYELDFESYSDDSDGSSDDDEDDFYSRVTPGAQPRIKLNIKSYKTQKMKVPKSMRVSLGPSMPGMPNTAMAFAQLKPPPENAVIGSEDAPWLQLTPYELAKLRKRMKKNAQWAPSETMIARELKQLGRGFEAYKSAKKQAEEEGRSFEASLPSAVVDGDGVAHAPMGAITFDAASAADDKQNSNRGMKLNEAKKLKKETLSKLAAQEAEESARRTLEAVRAVFSINPLDKNKTASNGNNGTAKSQVKKRKRDASGGDVEIEKPGASDTPTPKPTQKRTKTETPVPIPQPTPSSSQAHETPVHPPGLTASAVQVKPQRTTPVPIPITGQDVGAGPKSADAESPALNGGTVTTTIALKPAAETPIPPPLKSPPSNSTRDTRSRDGLRKEQLPEAQASSSIRPVSRGTTPAADAAQRRPQSRGTGEPTLAAERPRRASTARNTPAPEGQQRQSGGSNKRLKRPAPGVISRTNSGGSSAVGRRKVAPKKKRGRKEQEAEVEVEVEVDDEGNMIDPDEPRYCICNRVSFGTMISCDNIDVSSSGRYW
jgi:hypothetical protein